MAQKSDVNKNNKLLIQLTVPAVLLILYLPFNRPYGEIHSFYHPLDDTVPLLTIFVIPYISYYLLLIYATLFFVKKQNHKVTSLIANSLTCAIILAYLFYFFYQNSVERPYILEKSMFDQIYTFINYHVAPYNAFPSLHVAVSAIIWYGFYLLKSSHIKLQTLWILLIIISTVFTKQHYVLDIIGGIFLAVGSIAMIHRLSKLL
jgi:membrane-associated phospholipid phosphatase